jgi:hypothetical protein
VQLTVGAAPDSIVAVMQPCMVEVAQGQAICQVGGTAQFPGDEVVKMGPPSGQPLPLGDGHHLGVTAQTPSHRGRDGSAVFQVAATLGVLTGQHTNDGGPELAIVVTAHGDVRTWGSGAGGPDADSCRDAGELGVVRDALQVVAGSVRGLELGDFVVGQVDVE